jgi:2-furoate---CoA ligase
MDIGRTLQWTAERYPDRPAVGGEKSFTWRQWDARTNQIARALAHRGAARGERVCLFMANGEAMAATHLACQKLGALSTPLNARYSPDELAYCLEDADPAVVVGDDTTTEVLKKAIEKIDPGTRRFTLLHDGADGPAGAGIFEDAVKDESDAGIGVHVRDDDFSVMLYTAGTTGPPKGVPRTHRNELAAAEAHVIQARYGPMESTLGAMPMYHTMGMRSLLSMVVLGGKFVAIPQFRPQPAVELIQEEEITALYLVPTAYYALLSDGGLDRTTGRSVRRLAYAGAAMTPTLTGRLQSTLEPDVFINHYGSTEIYTFSVEEDAPSKPGSAGRPGLHSRLRLVRADAEEHARVEDTVEQGETGEIIASLHSPEAFGGYWHRPDADERLRDGWYFTGDVGHLDDEGSLFVSGRVDDMIITGGENVHPLEVEDALAACPDVSEVAVAGVEEEKWGQAVTAFVVAEKNGDAAEAAQRIAAWVRSDSGLTSYKRPKRIVVLEAIPKSPVGKILRRKLVGGEYESLAEADAAAKRPTDGAEA